MGKAPQKLLAGIVKKNVLTTKAFLQLNTKN
jgi:hypothetical protein